MQNLITPLKEDEGAWKGYNMWETGLIPPPGMTTGLGVSGLLSEGLNGPT